MTARFKAQGEPEQLKTQTCWTFLFCFLCKWTRWMYLQWAQSLGQTETHNSVRSASAKLLLIYIQQHGSVLEPLHPFERIRGKHKAWSLHLPALSYMENRRQQKQRQTSHSKQSKHQRWHMHLMSQRQHGKEELGWGWVAKLLIDVQQLTAG